MTWNAILRQSAMPRGNDRGRGYVANETKLLPYRAEHGVRENTFLSGDLAPDIVGNFDGDVH
jgi:hypothetical protein